MAKRDIELIVALAEGRLEDEAPARALIERSPRLRAAYEAQIRALEALAAVPPVEMTDAERSGLRRDLWTNLTNNPTGSPQRRGWPLSRLGYASGAAVLVIGLIAALGQLGTGADGSATAVDRIETAGESDSGVPPSETTSAGAQPMFRDDAAELLSGYAELVRSGSLQYSAAEDGIASPDRKSGCVEKAGLVGYDILGDIEEAGRRFLVTVPGGAILGPETPIAFVDRETCQIALLDD